MIFFNKKIFLILFSLNLSHSAFCYVWTFQNMTKKPILVECRLAAYERIYYDIINPGQQSTRFDWPTGAMKSETCVDKFFVSELNDTHLKNLFEKTELPTSEEIELIIEGPIGRAQLKNISTIAPQVKWISEQDWQIVDKESKNIEKTSDSLRQLPGRTQTLTQKSSCQSHHFIVIKDEKNFLLIAKE